MISVLFGTDIALMYGAVVKKNMIHQMRIVDGRIDGFSALSNVQKFKLDYVGLHNNLKNYLLINLADFNLMEILSNFLNSMSITMYFHSETEIWHEVLKQCSFTICSYNE